MASQKDKLLDSAQKATLKGQFDRAIKDYEQIIALEPKEMRHRQKLAELFARVNRSKDAIKEYEIIAKSYEAAGFYLKSIAVYKQIQKIDAKNISVSLTLASLNEKQGLVGNALAEYKVVVDHYEASGNSAQAAGILERMLALDQENLNVQLKLAETYFAAGMIDQAYNEFTKAVSALKTRGDHAAFDRVCKKMEGLFPGRDFILDVVAAEIAGGDFSGAVGRLQQVLKKNESNLKALKLLDEVYAKTGDTGKRRQTLEKIVGYFPAELSAKKGLIECTIAEKDTAGAIALLSKHASDLVLKFPAEVEGYYLTALEISPYENRLLEGLKKVYEATGNQAKLAEISGRLAVASPPAVSPPLKPVETKPVDIKPVETTPVETASGLMVDVDLSGFDDMDVDDVSIEMSPPKPADIQVEWEDVDVSISDDGFEDDIVDSGMDDVIEDVDVIEEPPLDDMVEEADALLEEDVDEIDMEYLEDDGDVVNIDDLAVADAGHLFDLSEEFAVLADSAEPEASRKLSKYSSSGVLSAFRKSVDQTLDKKDTETHYNLGIAYKEMGLFDDAIAEFKIAALDPARKMDCITLKAICYRDRGDYGEAEKIITSLLSQQSPGEEAALNLKYELAQIYEMSSRVDEALWLYQEIVGHDPDYRDVPKRLARLQGEEEVLSTLGSDMVDIDLED